MCGTTAPRGRRYVLWVRTEALGGTSICALGVWFVVCVCACVCVRVRNVRCWCVLALAAWTAWRAWRARWRFYPLCVMPSRRYPHPPPSLSQPVQGGRAQRSVQRSAALCRCRCTLQAVLYIIHTFRLSDRIHRAAYGRHRTSARIDGRTHARRWASEVHAPRTVAAVAVVRRGRVLLWRVHGRVLVVMLWHAVLLLAAGGVCAAAVVVRAAVCGARSHGRVDV